MEKIAKQTATISGGAPALIATAAKEYSWYEWGIPGNGQDEGKRVYRMILMGLMAAGYHTSDGKVVPPLVSPEGKRTTEELYK